MKTKIVQLRDEVSDRLDEIKDEVTNRGGSVSITRLIRDAIEVYVRFYRDQAVEKYSPIYKVEGSE